MEKDAIFWKAVTRRAENVMGGLFLLMTVFFLPVDLTCQGMVFLDFISLLFNMVIFLTFNPDLIKARNEMFRGEMRC